MPVISGLLSSRANTADPNQELVGFKDDPDGRGTIGLIWSCLLTLALCVWSALHLNIPPKYDTPVRQWSRMLRWVFLGILAPELVLWAAWRQWQSAKILTVRVQDILRAQDEQQQQQQTVSADGQDLDDKLRRQSTAKTGRKYEWTRLHSFYACMGGLVFDMAESTDDGIDHIPRYRRVTLSAHATILLARCGYLPDIDPDYIKDKSKADSLAKVIVLLQATWFLIQAIARLVFHLPVSLLEVNTIGHVLCALVMYLLWWNKPREVREPTVLHGDWVKPLCAFMFMSSRISGIQYQSMIRQHPSAWVFPELENLTYVAPDSPAPPAPGTSSSPGKKRDEINDYSRSSTTAIQDHARRTDTMDSLANHGADSDWGGFRPEIRRQDTAHTLARKRKLGWELNETAAELQAKRLERHTLCAQAFQTYPAVREYFTRKGPESAEYVPRLEQFLLPIATNWPGDYLLEPNTKSIVGIVLWSVSIMYGTVHLAAWKEYFPTDAERLIWHMSAGYIAASGVYWCIAHVLFYMWPWLADWWGRFVHLKNHWLQYVVYGFLMGCAGTLYILTRAYLTIEGLVSLRSVPKSMYETVEWEDYIPHF